MPELNDLLQTPTPNYEKLVRFLLEPLLENPKELSVNCEASKGNQRVLVRLAVEGEAKGRAFGRGHRNIEAVKTLLDAAATAAGQSIRLEIFGEHNPEKESDNNHRSRVKKNEGFRRRLDSPKSLLRRKRSSS